MIQIHCQLFIALFATLFTGCAGINQANQLGNPLAPPSPIAKSVVAKWEKELAETDITAIATRRERNDLVYRLIFMSDYRFQRYEADLVLGRATRDSFVDLSMFGINAASTLMTQGASTKMLSAIAGGLGFSRATIEKNFYMNHAAPVLMGKMRALRAEKKNEIVKNLSRGIDSYPASLAIIDVLDYYNRGTMLGALQAISNDTATQAIRAEGGRVTEPEKAPAVSAQIRAGTIAAQTGNREPAVTRMSIGARKKRPAKVAPPVIAEPVETVEAKPAAGTPIPKTAPPVIDEPIESITGKPAPKTTIPKTAPPMVKEKSAAEPL